MLGIERHSWYKALITTLLILAISSAPAGAARAASGPVTFTVRRPPLRIIFRLPDQPVRGEPTYVRAVVKNVGNRRLRAVSAELNVRPQSQYSQAIKRIKFLPAGSRTRFTWRVKFPKARIYILTAVAKAQRKGPTIYVAGAKKRMRVRRQVSVMSLSAVDTPENLPGFFIFLKNLVFP